MAGVLDLPFDLDFARSPRHPDREQAGTDPAARPRDFAHVLDDEETASLKELRKQQQKASGSSRRARRERARQASAAGDGASTSDGSPSAVRRCPAPKQGGREDPMLWLPPESDTGNEEYKLKLVDVSPSRFEHLVTQMRYRMNEGGGEACYVLGVRDDGFAAGISDDELARSIDAVGAMAAALGAKASAAETAQGHAGTFARICVRVRRVSHRCVYTELRLVLCGGSGSGKSTLVSVLTHGEDGSPLLDNGQGGARSRVFKHKHEVQSGRTSSISLQTVAYGRNGAVLNYSTSSACWPLSPVELSNAAGKMLRLFDVGGHRDAMKTTCYGMTCLAPDFTGLCVSSCDGVVEMTREHAAMAAALRSPVFVVLTKTDLDPALAGESGEGLVGVLDDLEGLLGPLGMLRNAEEGAAAGKRLSRGQAAPVPVIAVSSVTGAGIDVLHAFLKRLKPPNPSTREAGGVAGGVGVGTALAENVAAAGPGTGAELPTAQAASASAPPPSPSPSPPHPLSRVKVPPHFQVHKTFDVPKVGPVLYGTLLSGRVKVGSRLLLGPTEEGRFDPVTVASIQRSQVPTHKLHAGQTGTLALSWGDDPAGGLQGRDQRGGKSGGKGAASGPVAIPRAGGACRMAGLGLGVSLGSSPPAKKGTVLIDSQLKPKSSHTFTATAVVRQADAASLVGSHVVVHCGGIRQQASVVSVRTATDAEEAGAVLSGSFLCLEPSEEVVAETEAASDVCSAPLAITLRFVHYPEYIPEGSKVVFRTHTGRLGGVGLVN